MINAQNNLPFQISLKYLINTRHPEILELCNRYKIKTKHNLTFKAIQRKELITRILCKEYLDTQYEEQSQQSQSLTQEKIKYDVYHWKDPKKYYPKNDSLFITPRTKPPFKERLYNLFKTRMPELMELYDLYKIKNNKASKNTRKQLIQKILLKEYVSG